MHITAQKDISEILQSKSANWQLSGKCCLVWRIPVYVATYKWQGQRPKKECIHPACCQQYTSNLNFHIWAFELAINSITTIWHLSCFSGSVLTKMGLDTFFLFTIITNFPLIFVFRLKAFFFFYYFLFLVLSLSHAIWFCFCPLCLSCGVTHSWHLLMQLREKLRTVGLMLPTNAYAADLFSYTNEIDRTEITILIQLIKLDKWELEFEQKKCSWQEFSSSINTDNINTKYKQWNISLTGHTHTHKKSTATRFVAQWCT